MECVAFGRQPLAGLDLAFETMKIIYAGYWSAEDGRRISLETRHPAKAGVQFRGYIRGFHGTLDSGFRRNDEFLRRDIGQRRAHAFAGLLQRLSVMAVAMETMPPGPI